MPVTKGAVLWGVLRCQLGTNRIQNLWDQGKAAAEQREVTVKADGCAGEGQM